MCDYNIIREEACNNHTVGISCGKIADIASNCYHYVKEQHHVVQCLYLPLSLQKIRKILQLIGKINRRNVQKLFKLFMSMKLALISNSDCVLLILIFLFVDKIQQRRAKSTQYFFASTCMHIYFYPLNAFCSILPKSPEK